MTTEVKHIRAIIVDDEPLGRTVIREMLRGDAEIQIIGECANGHEAVELISRAKPELLFLDVQMPEVDGFEVLSALDELPLVIFVTAYDQYAVRAFDVHAVDYLLKPFDRERFGKAVQRAKAQLQLAHNHAVNERILALLEEQKAKTRYLERLVVKANGRVFFLKTSDVDWIEAAGNYVCLHARQETYLLRETLSSLETQLDPQKFPRIHRSQIVNVERIRELQPWSHGEYHVILHDGTQLTLSRSYREGLHALLGKTL
ncbi:MAG: response regulator transcription factor [Acidobacteria bacterium]|nr:response regulator transcription factor [Acidobacteriota bacterium]MBI3422223.1 response regulator transcription factor [Acidobacteriota bacterium]